MSETETLTFALVPLEGAKERIRAAIAGPHPFMADHAYAAQAQRVASALGLDRPGITEDALIRVFYLADAMAETVDQVAAVERFGTAVKAAQIAGGRLDDPGAELSNLAAAIGAAFTPAPEDDHA